jgi:hypothetical protein
LRSLSSAYASSSSSSTQLLERRSISIDTPLRSLTHERWCIGSAAREEVITTASAAAEDRGPHQGRRLDLGDLQRPRASRTFIAMVGLLPSRPGRMERHLQACRLWCQFACPHGVGIFRKRCRGRP